MGLPGSRDLTFIDGVSQIPAATMNNIQDGIANITNGAKSIKAMLVDGVGGVPTTLPNGLLQANVLGLGLFANITANTTLTAASPTMILVDTTASAVTITLPSAGASPFSPILIIKDASGAAVTHSITIAKQGTDTIDGSAASLTISAAHGVIRLARIGPGAWGVI